MRTKSLRVELSLERLKSLKVRLVISALILNLVMLPLIGFTLNDAFQKQLKSAVNNELSAYIYSVLAVAEVDNNQLIMPEALLENQFNVIGSGLYALITIPIAQSNEQREIDDQTKVLAWQSDSFSEFDAPENLPHPALGNQIFEKITLDGQPHLVYSFSVSFEQAERDFPLTVHIVKDQANFQQQIDQFSNQLWSWLLLLMGLLGIVQISWLGWTLRPLGKFKQEIQDVEDGERVNLSTNYPRELQAVANQLNTLLTTEKNQRTRYRNALSDLAHSLKTPLAVISSQKELSEDSLNQVSNINHIISRQLRRAQSAAGSSWHLGTKVAPIADSLIGALGKIYCQPQIEITTDIDDKAIFRGDDADLTEILGNLLDNACKAANRRVLLKVKYTALEFRVTVEDDGPGISAGQESRIFERGTRSDSYEQGNGIGLAIVRDLLDSYGGSLSIGRSESLNGAKFSILFKQNS